MWALWMLGNTTQEPTSFWGPRYSFKDFFMWVVDHGSSNLISTLTTTMWALWMAHNQRIFNGSNPNTPNMVANITKMVRDYNEYASCVFKCTTHNAVVT